MPDVAFATAAEIGDRLGRDLTAAETTQADLLAVLATGLVIDAVGKDDDWAEALSPVSKVLRAVTIEAVVRAMVNPQGFGSQTETLGAYSHTERFDTARAVGLEITDREGRMCRKAIYGSNTASPKMRSSLHDLNDSLTEED